MHARHYGMILSGILLLCAGHCSAQSPQRDAAGCRAFVQEFYDWYYNRSMDTPRAWYTAVEDRPQAFTPELLRLLRRNAHVQEQKGAIQAFDMDPFLNSQDPEGRYDGQKARVEGEQCSVALQAASSVRPLLHWEQTHWAFANFRYSFATDQKTGARYPDNDLLHMLYTSIRRPGQKKDH